ncbi:AAA family ATPase [candidate division WOR-3 bacterium]|nr:AAA family ATPase [candidate division WOR-3 bacterium]
MIKSINIKNVATIKNAEIHFDKGLNIITGETGAGKSLIFDAISLSLGHESDRRSFRSDAAPPEIKTILTDNSGKEIFLEIKIQRKGRPPRTIDGEKSGVERVRSVSSQTVMMFGQNRISELLRPEFFHEYLDNFSENDAIFSAYKEFFDRYRIQIKELSRLEKEKLAGDERKRLAEYELKELNDLDIKSGEWEDINSSIKKIENYEKIKTHLLNCEDLVCSSENGVFSTIKKLHNEAVQLSRIDTSYDELNSLIEQLSLAREEIERVLTKMSDFEYDSKKLGSLRERRDLLHTAMRKFGGTFENMINRRTELQDILSASSVSEETIRQAKEALSYLEKKVYDLSSALSERRKKSSLKLTNQICEMLESLGFKGARFKVEINEKKSGDHRIEDVFLDETGRDEVEFLFSANPDLKMDTLSKVVSGGELSRIALAIQATTMQQRLLPVIVFDEIDIGISGKTARSVGKYLHDMSRQRQVIVITHLPQIASFADHYIVVNKNVSGGSSETAITYANESIERVKAVAALASGKTVTKEALDYAQSLINSK